MNFAAFSQKSKKDIYDEHDHFDNDFPKFNNWYDSESKLTLKGR